MVHLCCEIAWHAKLHIYVAILLINIFVTFCCNVKLSVFAFFYITYICVPVSVSLDLIYLCPLCNIFFRSLIPDWYNFSCSAYKSMYNPLHPSNFFNKHTKLSSVMTFLPLKVYTFSWSFIGIWLWFYFWILFVLYNWDSVFR
jgi:hypothetical protein